MGTTAAELRLGIAITTLNRRDIVCAQVAAIRRLTGGSYHLVVCDDGSTDGTADALREMGAFVVSGVNRGTAWNKNRGIFYLWAVCGCDVVILLDDDMLPEVPDWQARWVRGASLLGHVNFIFPGMVPDVRDTDCTPERPGLIEALHGCCIAFHRYAASMVGYMDSRFGRYGHEHTEFTQRFLRNGFGGMRLETGGEMRQHYYVIGGGIRLLPTTSSGTREDIATNTAIWRDIQSQAGHTFRPPWHDDRQRLDFLAEMRLALRRQPVSMPTQYEDFRGFA